MNDIKQHPHFGKDLMTLQRDVRYSLPDLLGMLRGTLRMINRIRKEIGLGKTLALFQDVKVRVRKVLESDEISVVRQTGISEQDIAEIVERMALGQCMAKYLGLEKAREIRTNMSEEIAPIFFPKMFPTYEELKSLQGGYLPNLRAFLAPYALQNTLKNVEVGSVTEETETGFKLVITYCNFAKIAEVMGDRDLCYWTSCVTDGFFFPVEAEKAGVKFERPKVIAAGHSVCEFCWDQNAEE